MKKSLKLLFAPAIVLLLVAIMGVFSPVVSVAAALQVNLKTMASVDSATEATITNLPARTISVGETITAPEVAGGRVDVYHAGIVKQDVSGDYTYNEVGQYEWRFYANGNLFSRQTVLVTDTDYAMSMPEKVITVAPKNLQKISLPLPSAYKVDGKVVDVEKIEKGTDGSVFGGAYATITVDGAVAYLLTATVALENRTFNASKISFGSESIEVVLDDETTGNLKVTYRLYSADGKELLVALPLKDIEIKNVNKEDVTFANIPTAPNTSIKNLAYYSSVTLAEPTVDNAKANGSSFSVNADTRIYKVQCSPFNDQPKDWSKQSNEIHTLTVEKENGAWVVKENGEINDKYLEVDGMTVKIKALGWYRFQFETSTVFGYQLDKDFDKSNANIEEDGDCIRYWSDSIRINRDNISPDFAWTKEYKADDVETMNKNFADLLDDYAGYLPTSEMPSDTAAAITVNPEQGLVLPAIFPHDNATPYDKMKVTTVHIKQIQKANGDAISGNENSVMSTDAVSDQNQGDYFVYDQTKRLQIKFVTDGSVRTNANNNVELYNRAGLYSVRVVVQEEKPEFENGNDSGYANTKTKTFYFYVDSGYECGADDDNSPVIDEDNRFSVSDVYLWEGNTFEFKKPSFTDAHTKNLQIDYYLVGHTPSSRVVLSKLSASASASRVIVDLEDLYVYNEVTQSNSEEKLNLDVATYDRYFIYAVARNFNAMQQNLKAETKVLDANGSDVTIFKTGLLTGVYDDVNPYYEQDEMKQYGYAWKRAEFAFHKADSTATANITASISEDENINKFIATEPVKINNITATWNGGEKIDGQMSVAVYMVKSENVLIPMDVKNSDDKIISSVAFNGTTHQLNDLYFTPRNGGTYRLVVTAKNHASNQCSSYVQNITIKSKNGLIVGDASADDIQYAIDETIALGESTVLKNKIIYDESDNTPKYFAKNRKLYAYDANGVTNNVVGSYTITVLGVNDPNCIYGNKFVPNQEGVYTLVYDFTAGEDKASITYTIKVTANASNTMDILMGEAYDELGILWKAKKDVNGTVEVNGEKYLLGSNNTGTAKNPAYAITLKDFTMANRGTSTNFVVDSASLFDYLEPVYENGATEPTAYMYPAIIIPMPNVIAENVSPDEVKITVQKNGDSNYLVNNKSKKQSDIAKFSDDNGNEYFVFRPAGKFKKECQTLGAQNYLQAVLEDAAGVYTVTYETIDSSLSFNVTFGNVQPGALDLGKGFLTYQDDNGKTQEINNDNAKDVVIEEIDGHRYVTIDMSKVSFYGNADMEDWIAQGPNPENGNDGYDPAKLKEAYYWENVKVNVTFEGAPFITNTEWSDEEDAVQAIKITEDGKFMLKFDLNQGSGKYKVNLSLENKYTGKNVTNSIEFTIDVDATNRTHNLNNVWGVILMVLSLGLLAGVVYYFIKTARVTRFVDEPRAAKKNKKKAAKSVEALKEDVK